MRVLWPIHSLETEYNQYPGVMSISALLKEHGVEVQVVPAEVPDIVAALRRPGRTILAFSTPTTHYGFYRDLNRRVRAEFPDTLSVFGGPHPTFFPEMIDDDGVDALCRGEGEHPMLDLVTCVAKGAPITGIANWWVKEGGTVYRNPVRPLLDDLDELPIPDHEVFRSAMPGAVEQALVITSRGCPHRCTYCFNHAYRKLYRNLGKVVRRRSVEHVMRELREVRRAGCRFVRFLDDVFILSPSWVRAFCAAYAREIRLPFSCLVRANYVTEELVGLLAAAGCYRIILGIETGNEEVRKRVLERNMANEEILLAARLIREAGITLVTANLAALPGGSFAADWETLELNIRCRPRYGSVQILTPFPRTAIHDIAVAEGSLDEVQMRALESSFRLCSSSPLRFDDPREKRRMENLHKLFALTVRFPWLAPVVRRAVELPPNRAFRAIHRVVRAIGIHTAQTPPSIGLPMLARRVMGRLRPPRRQVRNSGDR